MVLGVVFSKEEFENFYEIAELAGLLSQTKFSSVRVSHELDCCENLKQTGMENARYVMACIRLALRASYILPDINKYDAFCTLWKINIRELHAITCYKDSNRVDDWLKDRLKSSQLTQTVEHPYNHIKKLNSAISVVVSENITERNEDITKSFDTSNPCTQECLICMDFIIWTIFYITEVALKLIQTKELTLEHSLDEIRIFDSITLKSKKNITFLDDLLNLSTLKKLLKELVIPSLEEVDTKLMAYRDPLGLKSLFVDYINACRQKFFTWAGNLPGAAKEISEEARNRFYAPYVALVQSSGSGKTRLIIETRTDFILIYTCLRSSLQNGWPLKSTYADYFLSLKSEIEFFCYYFAIFAVYDEWFLKTCNWEEIKSLESFFTTSYKTIHFGESSITFWTMVESSTRVLYSTIITLIF